MNSFDQYRRAKKIHGGRKKADTNWKPWVFIGTLFLITAVSWFFAGPGYLSLGEATDDSVRRVERDERRRSVPDEIGFLLTERKPHEMALVMLDVGQGDALFIQTPDRTNILIDSGEGQNPDYEHSPEVDAANRVIIPFLQRNKIEELDYFIATHPHSDHIGGAYDLLTQVPVNHVWDAGMDQPTTSYENMLNAIQQTGTEIDMPEAAGGLLQSGKEIDFGGNVKGWLLWTDPHAGDVNNSSLVLKVRYGNNSALLTGDLEGRHRFDAEAQLISKWGDQLDVDVLKIAHHGSRNSSRQEFVDITSPEHALIPVGAYNTFGHPTDEVLSRLREAGSQIHRTDEDGTVFMFMDGENIRTIYRRDMGAFK